MDDTISQLLQYIARDGMCPTLDLTLGGNSVSLLEVKGIESKQVWLTA